MHTPQRPQTPARPCPLQASPLHRPARLALLGLACLLCACGGAGDVGSDVGNAGGAGGPDLLSWNGSVNGSTVKDADNDSLAFTREGVMYRDGVSYPGIKVSSGIITANGNPVGKVLLTDAQGGGQLATTACTDDSPLNFTFLADHVEFNCVVTRTGNASNSGGSKTTSGHTYLVWSDSALEDLIKDDGNDYYAVEASSRQIAFLGSRDQGPVGYDQPTLYANTLVDAKANVMISGAVVGYVGQGVNGFGQTIAVFKCLDGSGMTLSGAAASASYRCAGSTDEGAGDNEGGADFVMISNADNGICIIDNSNDCFAFDASTGLLSFLGPVTAVAIANTHQQPVRTYGNTQAVYAGNSIVGLAIDGVQVASIARIRLVSANRYGAGLVCNGQHYAEIYENPARPGDALLRCTSTEAAF